MGREVKRVSLTDPPPMGETWPGYVSDEIAPCPRCGLITAVEVPDHDCEGEIDGVWGCYGEPRLRRWDPPTGDGWQMWENTTEGSPISPAFDTPEALARWLADTGASAFGSLGATYTEWLGMCRAGWAPSMVSSPATGPVSGVAAVATASETSPHDLSPSSSEAPE